MIRRRLSLVGSLLTCGPDRQEGRAAAGAGRHRRTDGRPDGRTDERADLRTDRRTDRTGLRMASQADDGRDGYLAAALLSSHQESVV